MWSIGPPLQHLSHDGSVFVSGLALIYSRFDFHSEYLWDSGCFRGSVALLGKLFGEASLRPW